MQIDDSRWRFGYHINWWLSLALRLSCKFKILSCVIISFCHQIIAQYIKWYDFQSGGFYGWGVPFPSTHNRHNGVIEVIWINQLDYSGYLVSRPFGNTRVNPLISSDEGAGSVDLWRVTFRNHMILSLLPNIPWSCTFWYRVQGNGFAIV
jgi:hypothetical protein